MSIYRKLAVLVQDKMLLPARGCSKSDVCLGIIVDWMYRPPHWLNTLRFKSEGGSCNSKRVNVGHPLLEFYRVKQSVFRLSFYTLAELLATCLVSVWNTLFVILKLIFSVMRWLWSAISQSVTWRSAGWRTVNQSTMQNLRSATTLSTFRGANGAGPCITEVHKAWLYINYQLDALIIIYS